MSERYDRPSISHQNNSLPPNREKALRMLDEALCDCAKEYVILRSIFRRHGLSDEDLHFAGQRLVHDYERRVLYDIPWYLERNTIDPSMRVSPHYCSGGQDSAKASPVSIKREQQDEARIMPREGRPPIPKKYISRRRDKRSWDGRRK